MPLLCTPITPPDPALSPSRQIFGFLAMTNTESREAAQHHLIPKPSGTLCSAPAAGWPGSETQTGAHCMRQREPRGAHGVRVAACHPPGGTPDSTGGCPLPSPSLVLSGGASPALPHKHEEGAPLRLRVSPSPLLPSPWRNLRLVLRTPGGAGKMI